MADNKKSTQAEYKTASPDIYEILKDFAKENRKNPTDAEREMWDILRSNFKDLHFRRQHAIGDYIADFVSLKQGLVIEIDGEYHDTEEQRQYDSWRNQFLQSKGFDVLRFTNNDILFDEEYVIESIEQYIQ